MSNRNLIMLLDQPLDDRNLKRFGIEFYINNNWQIQCWNFMNITNIQRNQVQQKKLSENSKNFQIFEFDNYLSFFINAFKLKNSFYYINFSSDKIGMILIQSIFRLKKGKKNSYFSRNYSRSFTFIN